MKTYVTFREDYQNYKQYWSNKTTFINFTSIKQKKEKEYTHEYSRNAKSYSYYYQEDTKLVLSHYQLDLLNKIATGFIDINFNIKVKDMTNFLINLKNNNFTLLNRQPKNKQTIRFFNKDIYIYIDLKNQKYFFKNR